MLIGLLITVLVVREVPFLPHHGRRVGERVKHRFTRWFVQNWVNPWHNYNFTVVFLTRSSIMLGLALFMTFIEYYFARVQHITNFVQVTAVVAILALGGGVVSGIVSGIFSDRLRRRAPLVCVSTLCMSLASFAFVVFPSNLATWLLPLGLLFGLGYGAYQSVDWALSIDVLPSLDEAGKDLGLWDASANIPAIIAPLLGSLIINIANLYGQTEPGYRLVFTVAALFLVVAAVCILLVREGSGKGDMGAVMTRK
jgi:MFS family permease